MLSGRLPEVLEAARQVGVNRFIVPGVSPAGWNGIAAMAAENCGVMAAFGLHPLHARDYDQPLLDRLAALARSGIAIGEIGLDYLVPVPRDTQQLAFRHQVRLAVEMGLPVVLHCRRAFADLVRILREEQVQRVGGVMHAFSGSREMAAECLRLGLAIGVAGPVTYRNAVRPLEVVRAVPLDRLMLETDSPDLAPEPYRGSCNEPRRLPEIAGVVAALKRLPPAELAAITTANVERVLRIPR